MPSSHTDNTSRPSAPLQSTHAMKEDEDSGLSHTLGQLTISSQRGSSSSTSPNPPSAPYNPPSRHGSPSPARPHSRSTTCGPESVADSSPLIRKTSMNSLYSANGAGPARSLSRRSSHSQIVSPSPKSGALNHNNSNNRNNLGTPTAFYEPDNTPSTAPTIAKSYFQAELEAHHGPLPTLKTDTVVIVNDAVYGHRFSRPRTSKGALSSIVERPERIKAGLLGVSLAYVRLGERHSDGAFPIHPDRDMQTLPSIPFRIHKSSRRLSLSSPAVTNVHGTKWMEELKLMCDSAESILATGGKELQRPNVTRSADQAVPEKLHEGDLYLCNESLEAMEGSMGAVCEAVDTVFSLGPSRAFVAIRPPGHHCSASHPSGFCWVNNVHVGIMHGFLHHDLTHAAIIDFDLHHGDGSQSIAWAHNARAAAASKNHAAWKKTSIGYFSLHDINSYPCEMGDEDKVRNASVCIDNAHGQTVWNVHLQPWETEQAFWEAYQTKYAVLLEKTRKYLKDQAARLKAAKQKPKAVIFLSAGFDASEWEGAGMQRHQANVPTEFYAKLTQDIIQIAAEEDLYVEGRVVSVLEGGYSDRALYSGIFSHLSGLIGNHTGEHPFPELNGLAADANIKLDAAQDSIEPLAAKALTSVYPYDSSWWAGPELDKLDDLISHPPEPPPKMLRISSSPSPAYTSPTQSSQAKVVGSLKTRRSFSALSAGPSKPLVQAPSPPPPPPEISWMMAAVELSKLLIPSDRQTDSCTHEDLNAEATRIRRDRHSLVEGLESVSISERPSSRMLLRERRSRATIDPIREEGSVLVAKNRRKTTTATTPTAEKAASRGSSSQSSAGLPSRRTNRGLSVSSFKPDSESSVSAGSQTGRPATSIAGSRPASSSRDAQQMTTAAGQVNARKQRSNDPSRRDISPRTPLMTTEFPKDTFAGPASAQSEPGKDDLSNITNGMKRIKINLITKSQKEAREQQARLEKEASVASQPPLVSDTEMRSSPSQESSVVTGQTPSPRNVPALTTTSESGLSTPVLEHFASSVVSPELRQATVFDSSPAVTVLPNDETNDVFVPYHPDGPASVAVSEQEPLKWLPPTVASTPGKATAAATNVSRTPSPSKEKSKTVRRPSTSVPLASQPVVRRTPARKASPKKN